MDSILESDTRIAVREDAFAGDVPLVAVERGGYVGSLHRGTVAVVHASGSMVLSIGRVEQRVFLRSAAKPFQAMPAVLSGAVDTYRLTDRELAVLCASHSAEPRHMEAVLSVLDKAGLDEFALHCGAHPPLHEATARRRWREGLDPSPVCNNCSGAHAGMLIACRAMGWPIERYEKPDHPLQCLIRETLAAFAALDVASVAYGIDNCAVPTFLLPLDCAARAFARLASGEGLETRLRVAAARIVGAMTGHAEMVAGEERFDTDLMLAAGGSIVSKGGAEGFQGLGLISSGIGLAMKISDGNPRAVSPATLRVLAHLRALDKRQLHALRPYATPEVRDLQNELVGQIVPVFTFGEAS